MTALLVELLAFAGMVGGFLGIYLERFGAAPTAVAPHVWLAGSLFFAVAVMRALAHRVMPARPARFTSAALLTTLFFCAGAYYALVIVGLQSWGRVVTWRLISTYAAQAGDLLEVIGWSPAAVALIGLATGAIIFVLTAWGLRRGDWTRRAAEAASPSALALASALLIGVFATRIAMLLDAPPAAEGEPVALTFFPERAGPSVQAHRWGGNASALAGDRAARSAYRKGDAARIRPNVILIVGDALRGDHLQVAGYARPTTPYLASLAAAGRVQVAPNMRAVCAESTCGLMGIAKSTFVHELTSESIALQEVLGWHGYRTRMLLGGDHTNFYELRSAYGHVDHYFDGSMAGGTYVNDDRFLLREVDALPAWDGRPEFMQFHLMSSHGAGRRFGPAPWQPQHNYYGRRRIAHDAAPDVDAINYYDNGVLQLDGVVEGLMQRLQARGYLRAAIVIVTGDHGEMLGEYGQYAHASSVHEGALRIPFVMAGFGVDLEPFVDTDWLATQADIAPTLLRQLGLPAPASWRGKSLQRPRSARLLPFQQGLKVGVYEASPGPDAIKYWRDLGDGSEYVSRIDALRETPLDTVPGLDRLRLASLPGGAGAVAQPRD